MSTTIRLSEETKGKLAALKREGESYEEALARLLAAHEERDFEAGFGILADSDTSERVRESHEAMDRQIGERVSEITGGAASDENGERDG